MKRRLTALMLGIATASLPIAYAERRCAAHESVRFVPDQPGRGYATPPYAYGTNARGFHERDLPAGADPSVLRVAVIGDSITYGTTTSEETFTRYAEERLGPPWQILNFAQYGYDIAQSAATLNSEVWPYEPDLVVYAAYTNDAVPTRLITVGDPPEFASVGPERFLFPVWMRERSALLRRIEGWWLASRISNEPDYAFFARAFDALEADTRSHETPLVVYQLVPHVAGLLDDAGCDEQCHEALRVAERMQEVYARRGVTCVSALPALRATHRAYWPANPQDWEHPSPEGHRVLGDALAEALQYWRAHAGSRRR